MTIQRRFVLDAGASPKFLAWDAKAVQNNHIMTARYVDNELPAQYFREDAFDIGDTLPIDRIIAAVLADNQSTSLPTWTTCQTWAVGGERDLSNVLDENLGTLTDTLELMGNINIDQLDVTGTAGAWAVFKVIEVKEHSYLLEYSVGMRIHGELNVKVTGELPVEGTYLLSDMTKEAKIVRGDASLDFIVTSHGVATIDKSTMGVTSVVSTTVLDESVSFNATNFPNYSTKINITGIYVNMSYDDYSIDETLHLELASTMDFAPALPLLKFPLTVGNNWSVDSTMTFEGTAGGYFNATGLPESFNSSVVDKNGTFSGSARIQDITKLGTMELNNGTIGPVEQYIQTTMQCVGTKSISVFDSGQSKTVFDVKDKQSGIHLYYSPDTGFLASALVKPQLDMLSDLITLPEGISIDSLDLNTEISMVSSDPATATDEISQIGSYQGVETISLLTPSDSGNKNNGQDTTMILLVAAIVVVAVVGVGGFLLLRKKKN